MHTPLSSEAVLHIGSAPISAQVLTTWILMLGLWLLAIFLKKNLRIERPGKMQVLAELLLTAIRDQINDTLEVDAAPYLPLIGSLFIYILCANLSALVPLNEAPTAHLETDAALAIVVFFSSIGFGIRSRGLRAYLQSFTEPTWIMLPLNIVETFTRTFSLMIRLFGNMMSGAFVAGIVLALAGLLVPIPFMALDLLVGLIQAYIFTILAVVFIGAAIGEATTDHINPLNQEQT